MKKRSVRQRFNEKGVKTFGIHLKQLRKEKSFTQERLADASGVSEKLIQKIEYGSVNTTISTLLALAHGLKVSMKELCDFKAPSEK